MLPCDCQTPHTGTGHAPVPPLSSLQALHDQRKNHLTRQMLLMPTMQAVITHINASE